MRQASTLIATGMILSSVAFAEVREMDGEEMVGTFVQGISIGQPVVGKEFANDDESLRDTTIEQRNALGEVQPELRIGNSQSLDRPPALDDMVANITDAQTRDLAEDAMLQTSLSTRVEMNLDTVTQKTGVPMAETSGQDFSALRGSILELLPSATGYQFEFMKERF